MRVNDCSVEGIDSDRLKEVLADFKPQLLVMNSTTPSLNFDMTIPPLAKQVLPDVKIAAFGIHVGSLPEESFALAKELDYIVRGEPKATITELAGALAGRTRFAEHNRSSRFGATEPLSTPLIAVLSPVWTRCRFPPGI